MLIESAFHKLPEVLCSNFDHADTYEGTLLSSFTACLLMELNGRNIPNPHEHLHTEKPYPTSTGRRWRADLLVKLQGATRIDIRTVLYGLRELNWIELKGFFEATRRSSSTVPKTAHAGRVLRDLLRVCLLPEELPGKTRQNARYLLIVLANAPKASLAFTSGQTPRPWLASLFSPGLSTASVDLTNEPKSLRKAVGDGFVKSGKLQLEVTAHTHVFEPAALTPSPVFFGYLVRVTAFTVRTPIGDVSFEDKPGDEWTPDRIERLNAVRSYVSDRIRGEDDSEQETTQSE